MPTSSIQTEGSSVPVVVSGTEAIIETFWDSRTKPASRWVPSAGARIESGWDCTVVHLPPESPGPPGTTVEFHRPYDMDISGYTRLLFRVQTGAGVRTSVHATIDGVARPVIADEPGGHTVRELAGPITGTRLTEVRLRFTVDRPEAPQAMLRWLMLDRPGVAWRPPAEPFAGMVVEGPVDHFEPGLGLLHNPGDMARLQALHRGPLYAAAAEANEKLVAEQARIDPASLVRRYALYVGARGRYDRTSDASHDFNHDGLILAMMGLTQR
ncbi:MAG: hypothetical protein NTW19_14475, partial [Planctomycetota bacterium]|nr:hypothetical protein [Planctomycetota bacterium]